MSQESQNVEAIYPLSPMQQGMLFHILSAPGGNLYTNQLTGLIEGALDSGLFRRAWEEIVRRHSVCRTLFVSDTGTKPVQVVRRMVDLPWVEEDWRGTDSAEVESRLDAWLTADAARPLDFGKAPLLRLALIRLSEKKWQFVWTYHHLILEGWSWNLLFKEAFEHYEALRGNAPLDLPAPQPYRKFIQWLAQQDKSHAAGYWKRTLAGFSAPTTLPLAASRRRVANPETSSRVARLPTGLTAELRAFPRSWRVTLNTLLQGAWALILSRHAAEMDVVFGCAVSGRSIELPGVESMVGLFINTLPVRVRVSPKQPVVEWLRDLFREQTERDRFAHTALSDIHGWSDVPRGLTLFDSLFVFENYPIDRLQSRGGVAISGVRSLEKTNLPLTLVVMPGEELRLELTFDRSLFDPAAMDKLLERFECLLRGIVSRPEARVEELPWFSECDRHVWAHEWNRTDVELPSQTVVQWFEQVVEMHRDKLAVTSDNSSLTFGQLNSRANALAHQLMTQGIGPDCLVALQLVRSLELVVAVIGVLKAGGAYVPIDPSYPPERREYLLTDSGARIVLTRALVAKLSTQASSDSGNPEKRISQDNLAYVIYTSGSTGRPKGVAIHHHGLANYLRWAVAQYRVAEGTGCPVHSSIGFDATITSFFTPLLTGGRVVLVSEENEVEELAQLLEERRGFSLVKITPAHIEMLRHLLAPDQLRGQTRALVIGGEALSLASVAAWRECAPETRLINEYGPTETVVGCCVHELGPGDPSSGNALIGRPIANTQLFILDERFEPVPPGVPGELFIGGEGLARGYLNRPDLTAERFLPDPFSNAPGRRLYRTGDLARYREDAKIEFLGRKDDQVKIRGFRVELGEIEAVLNSCANVSEGVVVAREDEPGRRHLVAYVRLKEGEVLECERLQLELERALPPYMVPRIYVAVAALPLTSNGKVDRRALPRPDSVDVPGIALDGPKNSLEIVLARAWCDVLRLPAVGRSRNFFELGGDSIQSIQVVGRLRKGGIHLNPRHLFDHPTIARLTEYLTERREAPIPEPRDEIPEASPDIPLTPIQRLFLEANPPEPSHYNQSVLVELDRRAEESILGRVLQALAQKHDALRLRFSRASGIWRQRYASEALTDLRVHDCGSLSLDEARGYIETRADALQDELNITSGPVLLAALFKMGGNNPSRLLLIAHHLVIDAVSWRLLLADLEEGCQQCWNGRAIDLGTAVPSFKAWAFYLQGIAQTEPVQSEKAFWENQLAATPVSIPADLAPVAGGNTAATRRRITTELTSDETESLLHGLPRAIQVRPYEAMLSALALALNDTADRSTRIDVEGHGRDSWSSIIDPSQTVGWLTVIHPLALPGRGNGKIPAVMQSVKNLLRQFNHGGIAFGLQQDQMGPSAPSEIIFNYLGILDTGTLRPGGAILGLAPGGKGADQSPLQDRHYTVEITAFVKDGRLQIEWAYGSRIHRPETIQKHAGIFLKHLRSILALALEGTQRSYAPDEFPLARLAQNKIDALPLAQWRVGDLFPLSPMQQGMLFHARLGGEESVYHEQLLCRIQGPLDVDRFKRSWEAAIERHSALRTFFLWRGLDQPLQGVAGDGILDWRMAEPGHEGETVREQRWLSADLAEPFDLERPPLVRFSLFRLGPEEHAFLWSFHHLLLDGWSLAIVVGDVRAYYEGRATPSTSISGLTPLQYRDYIEWLTRQDPSAIRGYWASKLAGFSAPNAICNTDSGLAPHYWEEDRTFSLELTTALQNMARVNQVTLNVILQAAWAVLLHRYTGDSDVLFGTTISGRHVPLTGIGEGVGLFINTLPVRLNVDNRTGFKALLSQAWKDQSERESFSHASLAEIQQLSSVPAGSPLFESLFIFENYPLEPIVRVGDLRIINPRVLGRTNYPLTVMAAPGDQLSIKFSFDANRFPVSRVRGMGEHFENLLASIVSGESDQGGVGGLRMMSEEEERFAVEGWNGTEMDYEREVGVDELVLRKAREMGQAVAVEHGERRMSYEELERRSGEIGRELVRLGVGEGSLVGVNLDRGTEMVAALLGVWRAGGAYVPMDPGFPLDRLKGMARDGGVKVMLTQEKYGRQWEGAMEGLTVVRMEQVRGGGDEELKGHGGERLAYVIYTSGSTGKPKGVAVGQRGLVNFLKWMEKEIGLKAGEGILGLTTISFDIACLELFLPLIAGAKIVMVSTGDEREVEKLKELSEKVEVMQGTPATWRMMIQGGWEGKKGLKILCGGEAMSRELGEGLKRRAGEVWNVYGPTETTVWSSAWRVEKGWGGETMPLGKPIGNTKMYVLDERMGLVPAGVAGELWIGGDGLARGYWGQEELTKERFVESRYGRVYRTGDVCRYNEEGLLEYLGRKDEQVKLRGYRIELGEIEAVLGQVPGVKEGAVRVWEEGGEKRLVGYVVAEVEAGELRWKEELRRKLPEYMVPWTVVKLESMPLTANGKVNRRLLPAPEWGKKRSRAEERSRTVIEEVVGGIWEQVLGLEEVGLTDNFFDLGGHSLIAGQVVARLEEAFEVRLPLRSLFERPTVEGLSEEVERRRGGGKEKRAVIRRSGERKHPLSYGQERMWFLNQLEGPGEAYHIKLCVRLRGKLDEAALGKAYRSVLERQKGLRVRMVGGSGSVKQEEIEEGQWEVERLGEGHDDEGMRKALDRFGGRSFDLGRGPLVRMGLWKEDEGKSVVLVVMHHVVSDAWSVEVFFRELAQAYEAHSLGRNPEWEPLKVEYGDYARWQRQWVEEGGGAEGLKYWKERLMGAPVLLELPTEHGRPGEQSYRGAVERFEIGAELVGKMKDLSRREGVTWFMSALAVFKVMLSRYSGQTDIVVGTPVANRGMEELEGVVGLFVNTIALRTDVSGNPGYRELLRRVRKVALDGFEHQEVPFEQVVQAVQPERQLGYSPVFQVMFIVQNVPERKMKVGGLEGEGVEMGSETAKFDLTMILEEGAGGRVRGTLEYNRDLFGKDQMLRMREHYLRLMESVVGGEGEEGGVGGLRMMSEEEERFAVEGWNGTEMDYEREVGVDELILRKAREMGQAVAVEHGERRMSYEELERRSGEIGRELVRLGVGEGSLVGVNLDRGTEMVAALLGVWRAGGAYVPMDPGFPLDRLKGMARDGGVKVMLTQEKYGRQWEGAMEGLTVVRMEQVRGGGDEELKGHGGERLAYVIYTSGSTGKPKGVAVGQRGLVNFLKWMEKEIGLKAGEGILGLTTISFDIACLELFLPLIAGAKIVMVSTGDEREVEKLKELSEKVEVMQGTPATWRMMIQGGWEGKKGLKILCGGEAMSRELGEGLKRRAGEVWNGYGPTETTVYSTLWRVEKGWSGETMPLGKPIGNTKMYVLDERMGLVPAGVAGELWIGGDGLARGYWGQEELTKERFVESRYGRVYRTGDVCRYNEEGLLEYLGRKDEQVKLRGYRIELGEIEAVLGQVPGVKEGAVRVWEEGGEKRLVGYVVAEVEAGELRWKEELRRKLPEYMVPWTVVKLESMPLTANGKVNRRLLPAPEWGKKRSRAEERSRTVIEEVVGGIWEQVLGLEEVGLTDNFFDLGGHSLIAGQVVARLEEAFEVRLPLRSLFERPTVEGLSEEVERRRGGGKEKRAVIRRSGEQKHPLSYGQERMWFLNQLEGPGEAYHIKLCVRLRGKLDEAALGKAYRSVLERQKGLRVRMVGGSGSVKQEEIEEGQWEVERLGEGHDDEGMRKALDRFGGRSFDLGRGPLVRMGLWKEDEGKSVVLVVMHHVVSDAWSVEVFFRELAQAYEAHSLGRNPEWEPLKVEYGDYARWQRQWVEEGGGAEGLKYWKERLMGAPVLLELPTEHGRPGEQSYRGAVERFEIGAELVGKMKDLSRREGVTWFMSALAVFKVMLSRYSGQTDIVVGTPVANRGMEELEGVVGLFVNTIALRTDVSGNPGYRELLRRVRKVALDGFEHQEVPFEQVVQAVQPERQLGYSPVFQVMFIVQNVPERKMKVGGLEGEGVEMGSETAKFDLTMILEEGAGGRVRGTLEYNRDLFGKDQMLRMREHYLRLMESVVGGEGEEGGVGGLRMMSEEEERFAVEGWNGTEMDYEREVGVDELILRKAREMGQAVAVEHGERRMSYEELERRSGEIGRELVRQGVGEGSLVGVNLDRGTEMVAALLGVWRAGGAYVPMDPGFPLDRLKGMARDGGVKVMLTQEKYGRQWEGAMEGLTVVRMEQVRGGGDEELKGHGGERLAYVIYTSGSTGKPKGVAVGQRGLVNFLKWMEKEIGLKAGEGILGLTTISFDIACLELFLPLIAGAKIVMVSTGDEREVEKLKELSEKVEVMQGTPATWRMMIQGGWEGKKGLKILCGGEAMSRELGEGLKRRAGEVWNVYGPTETTVWSSAWRVEKGWGGETMPLGRPIGNTKMYVLDERMGLVPAGVAGELWIGGDGLARGYWGQEELTKERFVESRYGRVYRTGDVCRYNEEGLLEYLGRKDEQVKLRGYRIELGEIEAVLGQVPGVKEGAVRVWEEGGEKRLVGYVVAEVEAGELRWKEELRRKLPEYMVPWTVVKLESMPLTANGKVNRRLLPAPDRRVSVPKENLPRTVLETILAGIWQEVLKVDVLGVEDNFFDLGGHSLLVMEVQAKLRERMRREVSLTDMFRYPKISALAAYLQDGEDIGIPAKDQTLSRVTQQVAAFKRRKQNQLVRR